MTAHETGKHHYGGRLYRLVSGVFGLFLVSVGIYVLFFGVTDLPLRIGAGLVIALLGVNMLWSAFQSKASWLSKLGPLP